MEEGQARWPQTGARQSKVCKDRSMHRKPSEVGPVRQGAPGAPGLGESEAAETPAAAGRTPAGSCWPWMAAPSAPRPRLQNVRDMAGRKCTMALLQGLNQNLGGPGVRKTWALLPLELPIAPRLGLAGCDADPVAPASVQHLCSLCWPLLPCTGLGWK